MIKKIMTVLVLGFVFSISSVSAKSNGNGNGGGQPSIDEDGGVAAAATSVSPFPKADFKDGLHKAVLEFDCVNVVNAGVADGAWGEVRLEQRGGSNNWEVVSAIKNEGFADCSQVLLDLQSEEFEEE